MQVVALNQTEGKAHIIVCRGFDLTDSAGQRIALHSRKAQAILAYLVLSQNFSESRERLAHMFWSTSDENRARASLRQCLKQLRDVCESHGLDVFDIDRSDVRLQASAFAVDINLAAVELKQDNIAELLHSGHMISDDILGGFEDVDREFDIWLSVFRQHWRKQVMGEIERILRECNNEERKQIAAETLLNIDPTHEEAHRWLIEMHARRGNIAGAIRQYADLWDLLQDDYDMEPSEETLLLIARVKTGEFETEYRAAQQAGKPQRKPAVAEQPRSPLPVIGVNLFSSSKTSLVDDYVASGFRSELVSCLTRFREWIIVESHDPVSEPEEPADYRLTTDFAKNGDDIVILTSLTETSLHRTLWSETYSFSLQSWVDQQRMIARQVGATLDIYISADGLTRQIAKRDFSLKPYTLWLRAQHLMSFWQPISEFEAEKLLREVIDLWPVFAPSYSGLANIYNSRHIVLPGRMRTAKLQQESLELARRAIDLDPLDARNQLTLAWCYLMASRYSQAEIHIEQSNQLNPSNPTNLISAAQAAAFLDHPHLAEDLAASAMSLTPVIPGYHWGYLAGIRFLAGDYSGCVAAANKAGRSISNIPGWKCAALGLCGEQAEAAAVADEFISSIRQIWSSDDEPTPERIVDWFVHSFPIRSGDAVKKMREGLAAAGLPAQVREESTNGLEG